ncbi:putative xylanase [Arcticibacter svalbardensis MN12-7]|uniref:Putative xylanase n=1 Tax=Arcticibacter svalbardensis MN12-7 TaxID=1150600 RepID=R9GQJ4_9SPHI|nr:glycoside hydrolase [Arcticibacter svalbardensis]EOR93810.1 putative xylanase [Arcticibacter svalbardensis MN12-7]
MVLFRVLTLTCLVKFFIFSVFAQSQIKSNGVLKLEVNINSKKQTIENFGASDAWAGQFVGLWPANKKNAIADLLFSTEMDKDGIPKGIGLSLWRFNLGAGSTEQGSESKIKNEWRRAESFFDAKGEYDFTKQKGQQWFLKAAKERGLNNFLGFFNSPPVKFTKNGLAFSSDGKINISADQYPAFSKYTVDAIKGLAKNGFQLNYISPVNEPQWDWKDGGQEGNPYTNLQINDLVKIMDTDFEQHNIDTKIIIPEAGKLDYLVAEADKPEKGKQIAYFFKHDTSLYNLTHVEKVIAGHSYFTTSPYHKAANLRKKLSDEVSKVDGLRFWMSEYCILGNNDGEIKGSGKDLGMTAAFYIAKVIHNDLVNANATAWQWWTAISSYNFKDGLVYIDNNKADGNFTDSKMLWAFGNYSRFIRPGFVRVSNQFSGSDSLLCSSFINPDTNQIVNVIIDNSDIIQTLDIIVNKVKIKNYQVYQTSAEANLSPIPSNQKQQISIPKQSIITIVGYY